MPPIMMLIKNSAITIRFRIFMNYNLIKKLTTKRSLLRRDDRSVDYKWQLIVTLCPVIPTKEGSLYSS
jgi:hypothetical protein